MDNDSGKLDEPSRCRGCQVSSRDQMAVVTWKHCVQVDIIEGTRNDDDVKFLVVVHSIDIPFFPQKLQD